MSADGRERDTRELDLDLDTLEQLPSELAIQHAPYDVFIAMSNEVMPAVPGIGRLNLFHCQFPFPLQAMHYGRYWNNLPTYSAVIVNSRFTALHLR